MSTTIKKWYDFVLQQMAAESYLNQSDLFGGTESTANVLMFGSNNPLYQRQQGYEPTKEILDGATRMTATQAADFLNRYTIVSHLPDTASGFSATLMRDNNTGAYTLAMRSTEYFNESQGGDWMRDGLGADNEIGTMGFAFGQIASMESYYDHLKAGESYNPATGNWDSDPNLADFQNKYALGWTLNVSGYSLSGSLASVFEALHPEVTQACVFNATGLGTIANGTLQAMVSELRQRLAADPTINLSDPSGVNIYSAADVADPSVKSAYQQICYDLMLKYGTSYNQSGVVDPANTDVTQLFGHAAHNDSEFVANAGIHAPATPIFIEDQPNISGMGPLTWIGKLLGLKNDYGTTHSITLIADSLAVMSVLEKLNLNMNTTEGMRIAYNLLSGSSNEMGTGLGITAGTAESNSLENAVTALYKLLVGGDIQLAADTGFGGFSNLSNRDKFYQALSAINQRIDGIAQTSIETIVDKDAATLHQIASDTTQPDRAMAYRYALVNGNPFVVTNFDYGTLNIAHQFDLYDPLAGTGDISERYLKERAAFVERKIYYNLHDANYVVKPQDASVPTFTIPDYNITDPYNNSGSVMDKYSSEDTVWEDRNSGASALTLQRVDTATENTKRVIFGSNQDATEILNGAKAADALFGGVGDDTLTGNGDNDYLEGGRGVDTYIYNSGDGRDTILDIDGQGQIIIDSGALSGGSQYGGNRVFKGTDNNNREHTYVYLTGDNAVGGDLLIDGVLTIKDFHNNDLGIALGGASPLSLPQTTNEMNWQYYTGNNVDTPANDHIIGRSVYDSIQAIHGGDNFIEAGGGQDLVYAGDGNNFVVGGAGADQISCGNGNDVIFGENQVDIDTAIQMGNDSASGFDYSYLVRGLYVWTWVHAYDSIMGRGGDDIIICAGGNDRIDGGFGSDLIISGAGNDTVSAKLGGYIDGLPADNSDGDVIYAGAGQDTVSCAYGNDIVFSGGGNDTVSTNKGDDYVAGDEGDDAINAGDGNDMLAGGAGNDTLSGGAGNDVYIYNIGDGEDSIIDSSVGGEINTLLFGDGIASNMISLSLGSLRLDFGNGDSIHIQNFDQNNAEGSSAIQRFEFSDGTVLTTQELVARGFELAGTVSNDVISGTNVVDRIIAGAGDDILAGGAGNDTLVGGIGNDTYIFNIGDGTDIVQDDVGTAGVEINTLVLGAGITADKISSAVEADGMVTLHFGNGDSIHINRLGNLSIQNIQFADGSVVSADSLLNSPPVANSDSVAVTEDTAVTTIATADLLTNDTDPNVGDVLSLSSFDAVTANGNTVMQDANGDLVLEIGDYQSLAEGQKAQDSFNYTIVDAAGLTSTATVNVTITGTNDAPVVTTAIAAQFTDEDASFSYTIPTGTFADIDQGDVLSYTATLADGSALPSWLMFDAATQTFSGTPGNGEVGSYAVTVTATDASGLAASSSFSIDVANVNDAPVVSMAVADQSTLEDAPFSFTIPAGTFTDADFIHGDSLSYAVTMADGSVLPSWLSFDAATQTFSGTPTNPDVGTLNVRVTATDLAGASVATTFALEVVNVNDAPVTTDDMAAVQEDLGITATGNVLANDSDVDQGTVLQVANAGVFAGQFGQLTLNADGSYTYVLDNASLGVQSLAEGQVVTETFAYAASDGITSTPSTLTVTITGTNDAPVVVADIADVQEDLNVTATGNVLANDSDVDQGTVLQVANAGVFAGQFGQLTLNADGSYTYVLDNASLGVQSLAEGQVVIETFAYAATDGITSTPSTLTVTITGTNDAPVVVSDTADVQEDLNVTAIGNVLANDSDVDQGTVLQVANAGVFAGQFGQLTLNADGSYTYVLDNASLGVQSLAEGQVVTETFAYAASDGITSTPSTLTVTITGTNDAPVVVAEIADQHTSEDEPFSYTVPAGSFADIDQGDALTYHAAMTDGSALPDWLKFDAATLTFSGTPSNWDVAMLDIAVTAIDKLGATATSAFQLDVQNVNDAPIVVTHLTDQHLDKGKRFSFTVPADTFDDWDIIHGDSLSYTATLANGEELPKWLTFDAVTRTFSGKATGSYNQDILLTVTDEAGASVSQVFSMGKDFHDQDDHCEHGDRGRNDHEDEDQCHHRDTSQDEIFTSSTVKDIIHTGNGADTIVYQRGDGQDTVYGGIGTDNTIVLAGGISKADIALSRQGNDLILETGLSTGTGQAADQITLRNWYDASANNKSVLNLALVTEAIAEFECGSRYRNEHERNETRIDQFDFTSVVNAFDQACSASTTFQHWNATQSLMTAHLHENEDDALGSSAFEEVNIATLLGLGSNAANQNALNTNQLNLQSQLNRHVAGV